MDVATVLSNEGPGPWRACPYWPEPRRWSAGLVCAGQEGILIVAER